MNIEKNLNYSSDFDDANLPQEGKEYSFVHDIFSPEEAKYFSDWSKTHPAVLKEDFREFLFNSFQIHLTFDQNHTFNAQTQLFKELHILDIKIQKLFQTLINRFAKELKLIDQHIITIQFSRYVTKSGRGTKQSWHFDKGSLKTMVVVLQNDYDDFKKNGGLDISFNQVEGPFSSQEYSRDEDAIPINNEYMQLKYPSRGGIIFACQRGHVIHRMSKLFPKTFPPDQPLTRTICQLVLQDPSW